MSTIEQKAITTIRFLAAATTVADRLFPVVKAGTISGLIRKRDGKMTGACSAKALGVLVLAVILTVVLGPSRVGAQDVKIQFHNIPQGWEGPVMDVITILPFIIPGIDHG